MCLVCMMYGSMEGVVCRCMSVCVVCTGVYMFS